MKKEEDDKLIKGFRERFKDYSEPVSDDVWSSLEKELSPVHVVSVHPFRKIAVAAAVLIILISSVSLWLLNAPVEKYIPEVASAPLTVPEDIEKEDIQPQTLISQSQPDISTPTIAHVRMPVKKVQVKDEEVIEAVDVQPVDTLVGEKKDIRAEQKENQSVNEQRKVKKRSYTDIYKENSRVLASLDKKDYKKRTVGISYGNSPMVQSNGAPGFNSLDNSASMQTMNCLPSYSDESDECTEEGMKKARPLRKVLYNNIGKDVKTDIKHKTPVTAGVSFRYNLSRNFAIETGLMYTMLSSELKSGSQDDYYIEEYKLHYIGLPLKGNWMFLNRKYLTLYLSAGGAIEKSLSGKYKGVYVMSDEPDSRWNENVKQVQWSVSAAVGAQLNATKHFGIYVEPGVVHYFDDGSGVQTIRKEKPTNFNLQLGLRWTY